MKHPRTVEEHVEVFLVEWSLEMPTTLHRHEVFFGPPDRYGRTILSASDSTPDQLVGGSLLGSPAYAEPVRHLLEDDNPHREEPAIYEGSKTVEMHLAMPLRSALRRTGRMFEGYLVEVARSGGDWLGCAQRRGCHNEAIARVYAEVAFTRLWTHYQPDKPKDVPRSERKPRTHSDWTQLSESQQKAIIDGENAA
jgi:hypothetical protein